MKDHRPELELEIVDFSDIEQLEEPIAPIFAAAAGGVCSAVAAGGCKCSPSPTGG